MSQSEAIEPRVSPATGAVWPLLVLFGGLYFVQGIIEPTAGMLTQGVQSQLEDWGRTPTQVSIFLAYIAIPWSLKPLFGLVSDFWPLGGLRRRPYLILSTTAAGLAYFVLSATWGSSATISQVGWWLILACGAVAMTDVVIDALAVETGQPRGLTGQFQSVQWGAMSAATILAGVVGGLVAEHKILPQALLGCGVLAALSLLLVVLVVREKPRKADALGNLQGAWQQLKSGRRLAVLASVSAFLFLWNFNPFSSNVLQHYSTEVLKLSEQFYGLTYSIQAAAQVVACIGYGFVGRRVPLGYLVHGAIAAGVVSTLCYLPMHDARTAVFSSIVFGLTYQLATLIQLDLAARICPTQSAGTIFALLMAVSNTGISASIFVSGGWYDALTAWLGSRHQAFDALVFIGAAFTAGCWLLVPVMRRAGVEWK